MNASSRPPTGKNQSVAAAPRTKVNPTLVRKAFVTSRLADFASKEELTRQIGHAPPLWPEVVLKELVDNALDACEASGVAPQIAITVDESSICVSDNGGGIPASRVKQILHYANKTSSNAAYVGPTRGQQGNALQTLLAMGHALGEPGVTIMESRGVRHTVTFSIDPIERKPRLDHERADIIASPGTKVTLFLPVSSEARGNLHDAAFDFGWINPHVTLSFTAPEDDDLSFEHEATEPGWTKWKPTDPTSPHWYDVESLKTLIAAEVSKANRDGSPQSPVRDFIADFRGLCRHGQTP
jgi:DNA topoisomerase VI subunit B